jgi:hypothetical protein
MRKVSLYLDDDLWLRFRVVCLEHQISASQQVAQLVTTLLEHWQQGPAASSPPTDTEVSHDHT